MSFLHVSGVEVYNMGQKWPDLCVQLATMIRAPCYSGLCIYGGVGCWRSLMTGHEVDVAPGARHWELSMKGESCPAAPPLSLWLWS